MCVCVCVDIADRPTTADDCTLIFLMINGCLNLFLLKLNTISTSGVLVEKKLLNDFRFSEYKKHVAIEDYLLWLQLHESLNFSLIINFPLLFYRKSNDSLTPAKGKIFMQKILLYSQYSFSRKKPFFFRVMVIFTYIMKSIFKIFLVN